MSQQNYIYTVRVRQRFHFQIYLCVKKHLIYTNSLYMNMDNYILTFGNARL